MLQIGADGYLGHSSSKPWAFNASVSFIWMIQCYSLVFLVPIHLQLLLNQSIVYKKVTFPPTLLQSLSHEMLCKTALPLTPYTYTVSCVD